MTDIQELIAKQRQLKTPPTAAVGSDERVEVSDLRRLIAAQREANENRWESLEVVLARETVTVELGKATGMGWEDTVAKNPPAVQDDVRLGFNRQTLPRDYPVERIRLNGAPTTPDQWQAMYAVLDPDDKSNIQAVIWWLHLGEPEEVHERLARDSG